MLPRTFTLVSTDLHHSSTDLHYFALQLHQIATDLHRSLSPAAGRVSHRRGRKDSNSKSCEAGSGLFPWNYTHPQHVSMELHRPKIIGFIDFHETTLGLSPGEGPSTELHQRQCASSHPATADRSCFQRLVRHRRIPDFHRTTLETSLRGSCI